MQVVVVGSGLAGVSAALLLADQGADIRLVSKKQLTDSASTWAQGGIAAVIDPTDSLEAHLSDTLKAGAGLCDEAASRDILNHGPAAIAWLVAQGVQFSHDHDKLHLTREGGHGHRRVVHAEDATGREVMRVLLEKLVQHPRIEVLEGRFAIELITSRTLKRSRERRCYGLYVLNPQQEVEALAADAVVLATGGIGKVYRYTTNPDTATGDGLAMAWRAGARVANLEFVQFHPTCLYHPYAKSFLISEAVRGEGGLLLLPNGERFMPRYDSRAELAPRDVVARAIDFEIKKAGIDCVYLDISHKGEAFIHEHFPTIAARCLDFGIDICRQSIPVVPAAHYCCGGVVVDHTAATDIPGLYAIGEVAYTGLHGANRLASNSLLECLSMARSLSQALSQSHGLSHPPPLPAWDESAVTSAEENVLIAHSWEELRLLMWNYVGIVRSNPRLERAARRIAVLAEEVENFYRQHRISTDLLELRNLVQTADLVVRSALLRHESRGLHYSVSYPETLGRALPTVIKRN